MDDTVLLLAASCAALAVLVYLMWRSATGEGWRLFTRAEKKEWRMEEEKHREKRM